MGKQQPIGQTSFLLVAQNSREGVAKGSQPSDFWLDGVNRRQEGNGIDSTVVDVVEAEW